MTGPIDFVDVLSGPAEFIEQVGVGPPGIQGPRGPASVVSRNFLLEADPTVDCTMVRSPPSGLVSSMVWTSTATGLVLKLVTITRTAGAVASIVTQVFGVDGVSVIAQKTETIARTPGVVPSTSTTREI